MVCWIFNPSPLQFFLLTIQVLKRKDCNPDCPIEIPDRATAFLGFNALLDSVKYHVHTSIHLFSFLISVHDSFGTIIWKQIKPAMVPRIVAFDDDEKFVAVLWRRGPPPNPQGPAPVQVLEIYHISDGSLSLKVELKEGFCYAQISNGRVALALPLTNAVSEDEKLLVYDIEKKKLIFDSSEEKNNLQILMTNKRFKLEQDRILIVGHFSPDKVEIVNLKFWIK